MPKHMLCHMFTQRLHSTLPLIQIPHYTLYVLYFKMHRVKHGVISLVSGVCGSCGVQTLFALTFCVIFALVFAPEFSSDYIALFSSCCTEYTFSMAFSCVQSITLRSRFLHLPPRPHRSRYLQCPCAIPLSPCDRLWAYICVHVEVAAARVAVKS